MNILIVCAANYCRSPVAEKLLQSRYLDYINFESAGVYGFNKTNMDPRSHDFLLKNLGSFSSHFPKKINNNMIKKQDLVYAMDHKVLMDLNKLFPRYMNKIKLFKLKNININITDPYKMNDINYHEIMEKIKYICTNIDIES